jgi:hypothetical protein
MKRWPEGKASLPIVRNIWRGFFVGVLACLLSREASSSTISAVTVPLPKVVSDSRFIVVARVEGISEYKFSNARKNPVKTRYFAVRIDEVLKPRESVSKNWNGRRIAILDPQEMFYQEEAELIAAGVISFVDARYPTKVEQIAAGDRLVFFLADSETAQKVHLPDARFLICGRAYDTLAIKRAVLKQLK